MQKYIFRVVQWLALSLHDKKVLDGNLPTDWGLSVQSSPCACVGFPPGTESKHVQITSTGYPILPIGVSANGCLCLCVSPATDWRHAHGIPLPVARSQLGLAPASP